MSKCNFECDIRSVCDSVCGMLDIDKTRLELEKVMKNCDWYEK